MVYHHIISLRINGHRTTKEGRIRYDIDSFFVYSDEDIEKMHLASGAVANKMLPTTMDEATEAFGCRELAYQVTYLDIRRRFNQDVIVCHFTFNGEALDTEWFRTWLEYTEPEELARKIRDAAIDFSRRRSADAIRPKEDI